MEAVLIGRLSRSVNRDGQFGESVLVQAVTDRPGGHAPFVSLAISSESQSLSVSLHLTKTRAQELASLLTKALEQLSNPCEGDD